MWLLSMTDEKGNWTELGRFERINAAAARIKEIEGYPTPGVFLETLIEADEHAPAGPVDHFQHTGRKALYGLRRVVH